MDIQEILDSHYLLRVIAAGLGSLTLAAMKSAMGELAKLSVGALRTRLDAKREIVIVVRSGRDRCVANVETRQ